MTKKWFVSLIVCLILLGMLAACGGGTASRTPSPDAARGPQVHMGDTTFKQASITLQKGQSITLVNDSAVPHIIANGCTGYLGHPFKK